MGEVDRGARADIEEDPFDCPGLSARSAMIDSYLLDPA